jgi:hypothetical protein
MLNTVSRPEVKFRDLLKVKYENYSYSPTHMKVAFLKGVM